MRPFALLRFAVPSLLTLGTFGTLAACEDSSGGGSSGTFVVEGGTFEASAPGDSAPPLLDAQADADASPEAGIGVTVSVTDAAAAPKAGVRVIFHDATGAVIGQGTTDATGKATSTALPSMVTVLFLDTTSTPRPVTFLGVTDGDQLKVTSTAVTTGAQLGSIAATFTPNAQSAKASFFSVYVGGTNGCSNSAAGLTAAINVPIFDYCARAQNTVFATASTTGADVAFALGKNVAAPVANSTVAAGPYVFTAAGARTLTATNLPTGDISRLANAYAISGTDTFFMQSTGDITTVDGVSFQAPVGLVDAYQTYVGTSVFQNSGSSTTRIVRREAGTADATGAFTSADFSTALPQVSNATATSTARPDVTISTSKPPTAVGAMARVTWSGASTSGAWTFVMPGNTTAFKVPALPADAGAFAPHDSIVVDFAGYVDGPIVPSYGALKTLPVAPEVTTPAVLDEQQPLPVNGLLKVSTWQLSIG